MSEERPAPVNRSKRMVGFYVGAGAVLALIITGAFLWHPLRLRYAIYRLEQVTEEDVNTPGFDWDAYAGWSSTCLQAALNGNRRALKAFMPLLLWKRFDRRTNVSPSSVLNSGTASGFVLTCPDLFFSILDERSDVEARKIICDILDFCNAAGGLLDIAETPSTEVPYITARLEEHCRSKEATVSCVAQRTLAYVRRRFSEETVKQKTEEDVEK